MVVVEFVVAVADNCVGEARAKENVSAQDLKPLHAPAEEEKLKRHLCVSPEPGRRQVRNIAILPDRQFLDALWDGEFGA